MQFAFICVAKKQTNKQTNKNPAFLTVTLVMYGNIQCPCRLYLVLDCKENFVRKCASQMYLTNNDGVARLWLVCFNLIL